jgi:hypothetical protein
MNAKVSGAATAVMLCLTMAGVSGDAVPAMAKTNCHTLCRTELKACLATFRVCKGLQGSARRRCRLLARQEMKACKSGVLDACKAGKNCTNTNCPPGSTCQTVPGAVTCRCVSGLGGPCAGFVVNPPVCASPLICKLNPIPDTGGVCIMQ